MKFSVLLPTRNRLSLLATAIETVRRQDYDNWEIVVSDNCSEEDVYGYVKSLNDDRIKYFRTDKFVPVTDNWNTALDKSLGDYVIMLGDDDGLMKGYFSTLDTLINEFSAPDCIYTNAFLYAYPGVLAAVPEGFLTLYSRREIFRGAKEPFWLNRTAADAFVKGSLAFRVLFDYNMQFSLVSRRFIQAMSRHGPFYQSPYPDYYASNLIMLKAERILVAPRPMVAIGISPKSFGYYYFNDSEEQGTAFLGNAVDASAAQRLNDVILPGTNMNTSWLASMETLADIFGLRVQRARYRELQIRAVFADIFLHKSTAESAYRILKEKLSVFEQLRFRSIFAFLFHATPQRYHKMIAWRIMRKAKSHPVVHMPAVEGKFNTLLDVFEGVDPDRCQAL